MKRREVLKLSDRKLDNYVKIQGTKFDRKRKFSEATKRKMKRMYKNGKSVKEIAVKFNTTRTPVLYIVDEDFKKMFNATRSGKHTGVDKITAQNRIEYKRQLVSKRKDIIYSEVLI